MGIQTDEEVQARPDLKQRYSGEYNLISFFVYLNTLCQMDRLFTIECDKSRTKRKKLREFLTLHCLLPSDRAKKKPPGLEDG
jgi:hypothetical protein